MKPRFAKSTLSLGIGAILAATAVQAANHREAPITSLDEKADITDVYAFVSYDDPSKATLIMNVDPLLEPSNGPTYFPFDPEIRYAIRIDNDHDAVEDIVYEFTFRTEQRLPGVFTAYVGDSNGIDSPSSSPPPVPPGTLIVPPAITALDGAGSEGLGQRQTYTLAVKRRNGDGMETVFTASRALDGSPLVALPSNAGPRTMPDYPALFDQAVYGLSGGMRVFAGTADDPFWIDLGATFDSLNFRPSASGGIPGVLSDTQDGDDTRNFAPDDVAGFNVNAIAIEVPIRMITQDGELHAPDQAEATIGVWATTSRPKVKVFSARPGAPALTSRSTTQIQRMGNPLVNELLIGIGSKDAFSMSQPKDDSRFASFVLDPVLARVLNAIYGDSLPVPAPDRVDLLPLVQYRPPIAAPGTPAGPVADLLRLNTGIPPTAAADRSRLGFLTLLDGDTSNDDPAGFPNGRRVSDDVVDITARAVAGVLSDDSAFRGFPHNRIGDGVNTNDLPYRETFPYLAPAHSGRNGRHVDPNELGCLGTCPQD